MIEHRCSFEQLQKLEEQNKNNNNIKEEIIQEVKKNLEYEGLYHNSINEGQNSEANEELNNSESASYEKKNSDYFLEEFNKNMINEMKIFN